MSTKKYTVCVDGGASYEPISTHAGHIAIHTSLRSARAAMRAHRRAVNVSHLNERTYDRHVIQYAIVSGALKDGVAYHRDAAKFEAAEVVEKWLVDHRSAERA